MKTDSSVSKFISIASAFSLSIGMLYGLFLLYNNIMQMRDIAESEVQIVAVLLATGLLGNVLSFVLEKIVKDLITEKFSDQLSMSVDSAVERLNVLRKEEEDDNTRQETQNSSVFNTVIVPVGNTAEQVKSKNEYICPSRYKFKSGLEYISFYKNKEIIGYGKITSDYNKDLNGEKIFIIDKFIQLSIPHNRPGAFVQNKMYCNIDQLLKANNTEDIRN